MPRCRLTDAMVTRAKPGPDYRRHYWDVTERSLVLWVHPSRKGKPPVKTFMLHSRIDGKATWKKLGDPVRLSWVWAYLHSTTDTTAGIVFAVGAAGADPEPS